MSSISNKKRKLSPTPSSSSSTPGPTNGFLPPSKAPSPQSDSISTLERELEPRLGTAAEAGPSGSGLVGTDVDVTPAQAVTHAADSIARRSEMRKPTLVAGSGDGVGHGDECYSWTDWPVQTGASVSPGDTPENPMVPLGLYKGDRAEFDTRIQICALCIITYTLAEPNLPIP